MEWPSKFCYHKIMTCSWGYGYSPWAVEFNFFNFIFVVNVFVQIKLHCQQFFQLDSVKCRSDGMACGNVNNVSKNGKYEVPSMIAIIFISLVWGFLVFNRMQCRSFFPNSNISTIVLFILKNSKTVVFLLLATLFDSVDFGFWRNVVSFEYSFVVFWAYIPIDEISPVFFSDRHAAEYHYKAWNAWFLEFGFGLYDILEIG